MAKFVSIFVYILFVGGLVESNAVALPSRKTEMCCVDI